MFVEARRLSFHYGSKKRAIPVLQDFSFSLNRGERCALIGPSGCGKSTLLYLLTGLLKSHSGTLTIDNQSPHPSRKGTILIPQNGGLLPWKTVFQNISLGLKLQGTSQEQQHQKTASVLSLVGLQGLEHRFPSQLSSGQRQKVAFARALTLKPDLLLLDEPFSALDMPTRESLQALLLSLCQERNFACLFVTHHLEEALLLADKILILSPQNPCLEWQIPVLAPHEPSFYESLAYLRQLLVAK